MTPQQIAAHNAGVQPGHPAFPAFTPQQIYQLQASQQQQQQQQQQMTNERRMQLLKQQQQAMRDQYQAPGFKEGEVISLDSDDD